jgi:hypothetical protein
VTRRIVKADEVLVEVYWQRPDRSKQVIRAWRDSTLFPTDLAYHRDHLGIVTDDFGPAIRIGDGDEVRDVVHPLAPGGPARYDYRLGDTLTITSPSGRLVLVELEVRPKDETTGGVVGRLFLDRDRFQVVRSELSFTPAAYIDRELEDIVVRLERALFEGRYWLPFRQVIEIRRRSSAVDVPVRTVIRGVWTIDDHEINGALPRVEWAGPSVAGLRRPAPATWATPLLALVDSSLVPSAGDVGRVRAEVARLARSRLLDGLPRFRPGVSRVSEFLRFNRVQGLAVGLGLTWRGGISDEVRLGMGYGLGDGRLTGKVESSWRLGGARVGLIADRAVLDVGDFAGASLLVNSIAAQEAGRDLGDYVLRERIALELAPREGPTGGVRVSIGRERAGSVGVAGSPARGAFRDNPALGARARWIGKAEAERRGSALAGPTWSVGARAEVGLGVGGYGRVLGTAEMASPLWGGELGTRVALGVATAATPAWRSFALGGPGTLLGEPHRSLGGRRTALASLEWLGRVPGPSVPLGWFGSTSGDIRIGPSVGIGWAGGAVAGAPWQPTPRPRVVGGLVGELFDRLLRVEVGWSLSGGGPPGLVVDFTRALWPVL